MSVSLAPPALISPVFVPPRFIPSATGYPPSFFLVPSYPSPLSSPRFRPLSLPLHAVLLYLYLSLSVSRLVTRSLTPVSVTSSPTPLDWPTLDVSLSLSLSLSLYPYSTLSVSFPRCRDLSRLFPLFPVVFETVTGSPMFVAIVDVPLFIHPHSADRSPLQRRPRRPSYVHTPFLALSLSLPRSSTHTPRTHHPLVLPFSYFPLLHETRTLSSDYRSSSLSADVCRLDDCHALLFNPCRHPALDFLRRIFAKFENVMLFLFFFFEDFSRIRHAFVAIRRHLNPPTKIYVLHWKNLFP